MTPAERVADACRRWGDAEVVRRCGRLLRSGPGAIHDDLLELVMVLGELTDRDWLAGGKPPGHGYWARVWAARALLYVWNDEASPAVLVALTDEQWRVREMAAKVVLARELAEGVEALVHGCADPVPRVRIAAARALAAVGEAEHASGLRRLLDAEERRVAAAGAAALMTMSRRLDRDLD